MSRLLFAVIGLLMLSCKVPVSALSPDFLVGDAVYFVGEETLFYFYEVEALQGLSEDTIIEITYTTDDGFVDWVELSSLPQVHTHLDIDCGAEFRCGSGSLHVPKVPRFVGMRLRYHRDSELAEEPLLSYNVVADGPAHTNRSALVYGVFDEQNKAIQWRLRHVFPTLRNQEVERLGLRREFTVDTQRHGRQVLTTNPNPYSYGVDCPEQYAPLAFDPITTKDRAQFNPDDLPAAALGAATVCARSTVTDAKGTFSTVAVAHKNPDVSPAFPVLRSPIRDATPLKYVLAPCDTTISESHLEMQKQRLLMSDDVATICLDDWTTSELTDTLVERWRTDIELRRAEGNDMVLSIALHHDYSNLAPVVEAVLGEVIAPERDRNSPRLAGAFVLDSYAFGLSDEVASGTVIWCPASPPVEEDIEDAEAVSTASLACAIIPDQPTALGLGPISLSVLPIFPTRSRYLTFIDDFSKAQAGTMKSLSFRVPELPPAADHVSVPPFGVATFFNGEVITTQDGDAFSFCDRNRGEYEGFVFRSETLGDELLPLESLPQAHLLLNEESYELGIVWDFPYLLRLEYEIVVATAVSAFSASLPFGVGIDQSDDFGSELWTEDEFSLRRSLLQCRKHCNHPTFDSAGIYQVRDPFNVTYQTTCYRPVFPSRGDSGFPDDP